MVHSSTVIVGVVEEPWQRVIRPDKIPKPVLKTIPQADGTKLVALPPNSRDYMVGYIYHVRVQEVFKGDQSIRKNQMIRIFVRESFEGGVSLPKNQRFLLALAPFVPKKDEFENASVGKVFESLSKPGVPFELRARYYRVASDRNGAIAVTDKNLELIEEIKSAIGKTR